MKLKFCTLLIKITLWSVQVYLTVCDIKCSNWDLWPTITPMKKWSYSLRCSIGWPSCQDQRFPMDSSISRHTYQKALNLSLIILTQCMFLAPIAKSTSKLVQMVWLLVGLIPSYGRRLTIIRTMFRWPLFLILMNIHSGNVCNIPQQSFIKSFTTFAPVSVIVKNPGKTRKGTRTLLSF